MLRRGILAALAAAGVLGAAAEPRIPDLEANLAERIAHSDFVFMWDIDSDTIGRGDKYRTFRTIHDGLIFAVTEGRHWIAPGTPATVTLDPMPPITGWDEAFSGQLRSRETALDGSPLVVHVEITKRFCDKDRSQVFYALSLEPRDAPNWEELRNARRKLFCDVSRSK